MGLGGYIGAEFDFQTVFLQHPVAQVGGAVDLCGCQMLSLEGSRWPLAEAGSGVLEFLCMISGDDDVDSLRLAVQVQLSSGLNRAVHRCP